MIRSTLLVVTQPRCKLEGDRRTGRSIAGAAFSAARRLVWEARGMVIIAGQDEWRSPTPQCSPAMAEAMSSWCFFALV
jgi:hypothetical protein